MSAWVCVYICVCVFFFFFLHTNQTDLVSYIICNADLYPHGNLHILCDLQWSDSDGESRPALVGKNLNCGDHRGGETSITHTCTHTHTHPGYNPECTLNHLLAMSYHCTGSVLVCTCLCICSKCLCTCCNSGVRPTSVQQHKTQVAGGALMV